MQGGIHPEYTGQTYLDICSAVKEAVPGMHVHAFSPLEVWQGAATLGVTLEVFLQRLQDAGLGTLPGTAAEILDDEIRDVLLAERESPVPKHELAREHWPTADYDSVRHDNRIWVAIRKLRCAIEEDSSRPRFLVTTGTGYTLGTKFSSDSVETAKN